MTTPAGYPAWTRNAAVGQYGGDPLKQNWGGLGVVDPKTDVDAAQYLRACADLAAVVRVAPAATILIQDTNTHAVASLQTGNITVLAAMCQWGTRTTSYSGSSPPAGFPSVTLGNVGIGWGYTVTFDASFADDFGVSQSFGVTMARVELQNAYPTEAAWVGTAGGNLVQFVRYDGTSKWVGDSKILLRVW